MLYRLSETLERGLRRITGHPRRAPAGLSAEPSGPQPGPGGRPRVVVVGYGHVGRTLARLLLENGLEPFVIELNLQTVRRLGSEGLGALYGDASHHQTLADAGLEHAAALILTSANAEGILETIRNARELNPRVRIIARTRYVAEVDGLRRAGADVVFSSEAEVAVAMAESLLDRLGVADLLGPRRDRLRAEALRGAADLIGGDLEPRPPSDAGPPPAPSGPDDPREGPIPTAPIVPERTASGSASRPSTSRRRPRSMPRPGLGGDDHPHRAWDLLRDQQVALAALAVYHRSPTRGP